MSDNPQTTKKDLKYGPHLSDEVMVYFVIPFVCYGFAAWCILEAFK